MTEIDRIDRRILAELQADSTLSVQELADRVGLTANPCWRRVKRLEEAGILAKRVALVDPAAVGLTTTVFVSIRTGRHDPEWLAAFARAINDIPEIVECHRMSGQVDYFLKIVLSSIAHYDEVYQRLITRVPGLVDVTSAFSMESLKYGTALDPATFRP